MMKKILTVLLVAGMLVCTCTGCKPASEPGGAGTATEALAAGRYMESEIELPLPAGMTNQMVLGVRKDAEGMTVFTVSNLGEEQDWRCVYFRHAIAPDGTVTTTDEVWLNELAPQGGNELHVLPAQDGKLYMRFSDYDAEGNTRAHILVSADDGKTGAELTGDGVRAMDIITSFGVLSDGRIAAASFYDGTLLLLDAEGNRIETLSTGDRGRINACAANGDFVAYTVTKGKAVYVYNTEDGSTAEYAFALSEESAALLATAADGTAYLSDNTGVYRHAAGGTIWEKLVEGETSTLGLPGYYASLLAVTEDGEYPAFYVSDTEKLLAYRYDPAMTAAADKTLTVFSLTANDTVRQAIVAFSRTRSDVKVTYTVAMEGASGGTEQDYIKALNTELLAGAGPDILLLDGLPLDSYIEKDVLADLTEVIDGSEPYSESILSAFSREDGALYAVPAGFTLPFAVAPAGMENAFVRLSALADAAERAGEPPLISPCAFSYKTLALCLLKYYGGTLGTGESASVEAFLKDAKRISEAIGCTEKLGEGWDALRDMSQDELYDTFGDYFGSPQVFATASGNAKAILMQPVGSVMGCMEALALAEKLSASIVSVGGQFVPSGIVGVNKASGEPEAAAAFVRTLLSYDAQGGNQYAKQFPVNARALSEMLAYQNDGVSSGFMLNDGGEFTATWPSKVWRDRLGALIDSLDTPIVADAALNEMLLPVVEACLSGASTPAQAAEQMESLLATYLAE